MKRVGLIWSLGTSIVVLWENVVYSTNMDTPNMKQLELLA